ncbi:protein FAM76B isoform X3 [Drosophila bipectinata]|uniref:protein FAM76B isoform X3 n=1 Tax=Drosophila bipectinata TaxID=42026 RepID=UPI001C89A27B|nr:protein FAM76B isoform X2 [Drosophila bipectinata]
MSAKVLFACSKCFSRHPYEELSSGQQLCKGCRGSTSVVKCTYCRSEFQPATKSQSACKKCEHYLGKYGKPTPCECCKIVAAFGSSKCMRSMENCFAGCVPVRISGRCLRRSRRAEYPCRRRGRMRNPRRRTETAPRPKSHRAVRLARVAALETVPAA